MRAFLRKLLTPSRPCTGAASTKRPGIDKPAGRETWFGFAPPDEGIQPHHALPCRSTRS